MKRENVLWSKCYSKKLLLTGKLIIIFNMHSSLVQFGYFFFLFQSAIIGNGIIGYVIVDNAVKLTVQSKKIERQGEVQNIVFNTSKNPS